MSSENGREKPHFGYGHMCAGCPLTMTEHTGCVVGSNVVVYLRKVQIYKRRPKENPTLNKTKKTEPDNK